ncbi:unnamed protein product [Thelazia callipaeda]|uniref:Phage protein n=1 Tax=Thelazia callipaeda TaxID=103827 RepID=A0A0N5D3C3_THECL|nr:unnamed protein product [Thelazia callipaeda]
MPRVLDEKQKQMLKILGKKRVNGKDSSRETGISAKKSSEIGINAGNFWRKYAKNSWQERVNTENSSRETAISSEKSSEIRMSAENFWQDRVKS